MARRAAASPLGHELGHWVMHRAARAAVAFLPPRRGRPEQKTDRPARPAARDRGEANVFAAALTMPAHLIREHYERLARPQTTATSGCASYSPRQERRWADDYMQ